MGDAGREANNELCAACLEDPKKMLKKEGKPRGCGIILRIHPFIALIFIDLREVPPFEQQ